MQNDESAYAFVMLQKQTENAICLLAHLNI